MTKRISLRALVSIAKMSMLLTTATHAQEVTEPHENAAALYQQHCAGCHGRAMQGASAPALITNDWKFGRGGLTVGQSIAFGRKGTDMPAFATILTHDEIDAVTEYVTSAQTSLPAVESLIPATVDTVDYQLRIEKIARDSLSKPWSVEFVSADLALITEVEGHLRWIRNGVVDPQEIEGIPESYRGTGITAGLMDVALDPAYEENRWVYLAQSFSHGESFDTNAAALTRVVRGRVDGYRWVDEQVVYQAKPTLWPVGGERWGCRLIFDREGRLVFGIGDMGKGEDSQDASKPTGKIFRIWPDGGAVEENPWSNVDDAIPGLVALGVRNAQGMDVHPDTGQIWFTDHGPMGGDELNVLKPGANYGWPVITYGIDYNGEPVSDLTQKDGMEQPVLHWTPSKAVDAAVFVSSLQFSKWKNRLLVGSLAFEELWLYTIDGDRVSDEELIFKNFGRIRDLKFGPDGALYAVMNNPDLILRVSVP